MVPVRPHPSAGPDSQNCRSATYGRPSAGSLFKTIGSAVGSTPGGRLWALKRPIFPRWHTAPPSSNRIRWYGRGPAEEMRRRAGRSAVGDTDSLGAGGGLAVSLHTRCAALVAPAGRHDPRGERLYAEQPRWQRQPSSSGAPCAVHCGTGALRGRRAPGASPCPSAPGAARSFSALGAQPDACLINPALSGIKGSLSHR